MQEVFREEATEQSFAKKNGKKLSTAIQLFLQQSGE